MIIGRSKEQEILNSALHDTKSHFIAIYGRRRIGKTYLIRETFGQRFTFQHAGLSGGGMKEQLFAFYSSLKDAGYECQKTPGTWLEAFDSLKDLVRTSKEKRKIIFIDELSWMDTQKSNMIMALENFWNGFASARNDVVLIVCASATSWMLSKVVHNKGGLYNRLTKQMNLRAFTLKECEEYVQQNQLSLTRGQILQYYMIFGGVPYYWGFLEKGLSLSQNIDAILFSENAPLKEEYKYLYASIFKNPEKYIKIVECLAKKKFGMTREEIIAGIQCDNSGDLTVKLEELESCGFIRKYSAFGMKKKGALYQLIDHFTLFYYRFLEKKNTDEHFWSNQINTPMVNTWMGLAFEMVCLHHIPQIKEKLGIPGVLTEVNSWYCKEDKEKGIWGSQIDLLIVRKDQVINLCEMKYSGSEYSLQEKEYRAIQRKMQDFRTLSGTKYAIHPTLITTYGLMDTAYSGEIQVSIRMEDLFR